MFDLKALATEMTIRMNTVEAMDNAGYDIDTDDLETISDIATILSALAPELIDPRF